MPHILDAEGRELPPGQEGTIYFSDGVEFVYHNDPAKTASIRAKTRSAEERPSWNWLQNEAMLVKGHQKKPTACMNRYQLPGQTAPLRSASTNTGWEVVAWFMGVMLGPSTLAE